MASITLPSAKRIGCAIALAGLRRVNRHRRRQFRAQHLCPWQSRPKVHLSAWQRRHRERSLASPVCHVRRHSASECWGSSAAVLEKPIDPFATQSSRGPRQVRPAHAGVGGRELAAVPDMARDAGTLEPARRASVQLPSVGSAAAGIAGSESAINSRPPRRVAEQRASASGPNAGIR